MLRFKFIALFLIAFMFIFSACNTETKTEDAKETPKKPKIINGLFLEKYENGVKQMEGNMKDAKRNGPWKAWYPDGTIWSEGEYKDGKREGKSTVYFENGKIRYEGNYKNDTQIGIWKYYDESGKLIEEKNYDLVQ